MIIEKIKRAFLLVIALVIMASIIAGFLPTVYQLPSLGWLTPTVLFFLGVMFGLLYFAFRFLTEE